MLKTPLPIILGCCFLLWPLFAFSLSETEWKNKNLSFTKHQEVKRERQKQKKSLKSAYAEKLKKNLALRLQKQRNYAEDQVIENKKTKAKKFFQTFLNKQPGKRSLAKKQFLRVQKAQNKLKKKYAVPLAKQLFE